MRINLSSNSQGDPWYTAVHYAAQVDERRVGGYIFDNKVMPTTNGARWASTYTRSADTIDRSADAERLRCFRRM